MTASNLNQLYGEIKTPARDVTDVEQKHECKCVISLEVDSKLLLEHMKAAQSYNPGIRLHTYIPFLWLMRVDGTVVVAVEELVDTEKGTPIGLFTGGTDDRELKLGHPALTGDKEFRARIAGELKFDKEWIITNASGRYGDKARTTKEQLENVAKLFNDHHIPVRAEFVIR